MEISVKQVKDWQEAMERKASLQNNSSQHKMHSRVVWIPPAHGHSKLNVDASLYSGGSSFNIGMVIRSERGQFVKDKNKNMCVQVCVSVMEAEARGVQLAIDWIEEMGLQQVDIESDSELVVKTVKNEAHYYSEVGHILDYCRLKISNRQDLSLCHVKRQANHAAHLMARALCLSNCFNIFLTSFNYVVGDVIS